MLKKLLIAAGASAAAMAATAKEAAPDQGAAEFSGLEEIVVTAQRREESAQRAALAIDVVTAEELQSAGVVKPEDLMKVVPGLNIGTGGNMPQVYIRGIGTYATNNYADSPIATNIDGVYVSRPWAVRGSFFDLERVEALKGPQGTLYGRNASGGAINLITRRPTFDDVGGYVDAEVGNYNLTSITGAINVPASQTLAFRVAGQSISRDGYLSDGSDDQKSQSARIHTLFQPSLDLSLLVTANYQHTGGRGGGITASPDTPYIANGGSRWTSMSDPNLNSIIANAPFAPGLHLQQAFPDNYLDSTVRSLSAELNWNFGPATLTVLPAYRDAKQSDRFYVATFKGDEAEFNHQSTLEVRLANSTDKLKWVFGGYYFNEDQGNQTGKSMRFTTGYFNGEDLQALRLNARSYAAFGQATFSVLPTLRLTGGLRYTYEKKKQAGFADEYSAGPPSACTGVFAPTTAQFPNLTNAPDANCVTRIVYDTTPIKNDKVTWKAGVEFDVAQDSLLYANASTGFKSGGLFSAPTTPTDSPTYKPEQLTAFELGSKNRLLDNRLQLNVEAFYYDYKDHQENHLKQLSNGIQLFVTDNAGKAKSYGLEADVVFQPVESDRFALNVQYDKSKYDTFVYKSPDNPPGVPPETTCKITPTDFVGSTPFSSIVDCSGNQMVRTPEWQANASYDHYFPLSNGGTFDVGAAVRYASKSYLGVEFLDSEINKAYSIWDANVGYSAPEKKWSITGWVRNIGNKAVYTQAFPSPFVAPQAVYPAAGKDGFVGESIQAPRTYGLSLHASF